MEHVKQEVAKNPEKAKDWEKVQQTAASVSAKLHSAKDTVSPGYTKAKDMFAKIKASAGKPAAQPIDKPLSRFALLRARLDELKSHPTALKTSEFLSKTSAVLGARLASSMDKFNQVVLRRLQEDEHQPELHARWSAQRAARQHAAAQPAAGAQPAAQAAQPHPHGDALTVTEQPKAGGGFGLGGMDAMPLLTETVSRLLGESEIAQCVREMKTLDANFRLSALQDEMERIVAPKFLEWFLAGDREKLRVHLGEAAFASVNSSLQARLKARAKPDQRILYGPRDVELRLAIPAEEAGSESPCFVFQFVTQQVNCFRKVDGQAREVVEGAPDDIRELHYVVAITRNPLADVATAAAGEQASAAAAAEAAQTLEHPWLIKELAIVGNRRTW